MKRAVAAVAIRQPPLPLLRYGADCEVILIKATPIGRRDWRTAAPIEARHVSRSTTVTLPPALWLLAGKTLRMKPRQGTANGAKMSPSRGPAYLARSGAGRSPAHGSDWMLQRRDHCWQPSGYTSVAAQQILILVRDADAPIPMLKPSELKSSSCPSL